MGKHMWILCFVMCVSVVTPAVAGGTKPLLEGSYEVVRSTDNKSGAEVVVGDVLKGQRRLWVRIVLTFDGDKLTSTLQSLAPAKRLPGAYEGCEARVETTVVWNAKGYTIAQPVSGGSDVILFSELTEKKEKAASTGCSNGIDPGTFTVVLTKDGVRLDAAAGFLTLKRTELKPDWGAAVRGH
jgi:hypothetical protein